MAKRTHNLSWLRIERERQGIDQRELAGRLGTRQAVISRIEHGKRKPSLAYARRIADALDTDVDRVFPPDNVRPPMDVLQAYLDKKLKQGKRT